MAGDLRITELPPLAEADVVATDVLPIADVSASTTKKLTAKDLIQGGVDLIDNGSIDGAKLATGSVTALQLGPDSVTASELADGAVDTAAIQSNAVTNSKIAAGVDGAKLIDDTVTAAKIPTASLNRGIDKTGGAIGHTNSVTAGARNGISFDAQGHVTGTAPLVPSDLPIATDSQVGAVSVPAVSGLQVSGTGALAHADTVAPGTASGITFNATGHITAAVALVSGDLPDATTTAKGAVSVPGPGLLLSAGAVLTHADSGVVAGVHQSVTVDQRGHVTSGGPLSAAMVPNLDASKINTGQFGTPRIADDAITRDKLADYTVSFIQEAQPTELPHNGCLWYQESTAQLRMWNGNSWMPVGFGRLSEENLRFSGTFDAQHHNVVQVTQFGTIAGLTAGGALPAATDSLTGVYLVVTVPGNYGGSVYDNGDWVLCLGTAQGWVRVDTLTGGGTTTIRLQDLLDTNITTPASGDTLIFDGATNKWINRPTAAQKATFVEVVDGIRTSFTLSRDAASANNLLISIGGIIQEPGVDFTFTAPRTVNFVAPPPAGIDYWVIVEGVTAAGGGGGGGTTLPDGTAAEEYLRWNNTLSSWQPSTTLDGGQF